MTPIKYNYKSRHAFPKAANEHSASLLLDVRHPINLQHAGSHDSPLSAFILLWRDVTARPTGETPKLTHSAVGVAFSPFPARPISAARPLELGENPAIAIDHAGPYQLLSGLTAGLLGLGLSRSAPADQYPSARRQHLSALQRLPVPRLPEEQRKLLRCRGGSAGKHACLATRELPS